MADWVGVGKFLLDGYGEEPSRPLLRTEMESGPAKQRPTSTKEIFSGQRNVLFTQSEYIQFKTWRRSTINNGAAFFTLTDPMDGVSKQVRMVGGKFSSRFTSGGPGAPLQVTVSFELEVIE